MNKIITLLLFFSINFLFAKTNNIEHSLYTKKTGEEQIVEYDVNAKINKDASADIKEDIYYDFGKHYRHGFYRNIPLDNGKIEIKLEKVLMDDKKKHYTTSYKNDNLIIKIGNKFITITGIHKYSIFYKIKYIVFPYNKNFNKTSLNLIGTGFKTVIHNVNLKVYLPEDFKNLELGKNLFIDVYYGDPEDSTKLKFDYDMKTNSIFIHKDYISPYMGITVDIIFPKNLIPVVVNPYYAFKEKILFLWIASYKYVSIVFLIFIFIYLYKKYNEFKIPEFSISPQYYPPENFDVLEIGLIVDQIADKKDIGAAILQLAAKGYIKIEKNEYKTILGLKNEYSIILTRTDKEIKNDLEEHMKIILKNLFYNDKQIEIKKKDKDIAKKLRTLINSVNNKLYSWIIKKKIWKNYPDKIANEIKGKFLLYSLPFYIYTILPLILGIKYDLLEKIYYMPLIFTFLYSGIIYFVIKYFYEKMKKSMYWQIGVLGSILFFYIYINIKFDIPLYNPFSIIFVSLLGFIFVMQNINPYTETGFEIFKKVKGFKEFVKKVEKDKVQRLVEEDPNYLNLILPYAVLFGAKHWLDFYKEFGIEETLNEWSSGNITDAIILYHFMENDFLGAVDYNPTDIKIDSSNTNIFSGGGSAGGGFGGGGGGSW